MEEARRAALPAAFNPDKARQSRQEMPAASAPPANTLAAKGLTVPTAFSAGSERGGVLGLPAALRPGAQFAGPPTALPDERAEALDPASSRATNAAQLPAAKAMTPTTYYHTAYCKFEHCGSTFLKDAVVTGEVKHHYVSGSEGNHVMLVCPIPKTSFDSVRGGIWWGQLREGVL